jgi:hypothetical protein
VDARLPIDADLLDRVVRTFVGLDAAAQEEALLYLRQLRNEASHSRLDAL